MEWGNVRGEYRRESRIESTVEVLELRIRGTKDSQGGHTDIVSCVWRLTFLGFFIFVIRKRTGSLRPDISNLNISSITVTTHFGEFS